MSRLIIRNSFTTVKTNLEIINANGLFSGLIYKPLNNEFYVSAIVRKNLDKFNNYILFTNRSSENLVLSYTESDKIYKVKVGDIWSKYDDNYKNVEQLFEYSDDFVWSSKKY